MKRLMEESRPGVDWHPDGEELPFWLLLLIIGVMALPVSAAGALIVVLWLA